MTHRPRARRTPRAPAALLRAAAGLALALAVGPAGAQDRPTVVVTDPGAGTYRISVQAFAAGEAVPAERADTLRGHLVEALEYSGLFESIDPEAFLGPLRTPGLDERLVCPDWSQIRSDALVQGEIRGDGGDGRVVAEYRVVDVARNCRSLRRHRYRGGVEDLRLIARRIADDVVGAFTGQRGVASTEIAFVSDRSGDWEVHLLDADGSNPRAVTREAGTAQFPSWHPSGDEIVYTAYRDGGRPHVFILSRTGRSGRILGALDPRQSQYRAVFDPEGSRLAVVATRDGGASELFTVSRTGRGLRQLTDNRSIDVSPTWSPDGERLAFVSDRAGSPQVYVMNRDGSGVRRLTFNGGYNTSPAWSPDGRWIAYEARVGGQFDIWLIDPEGTVNVPLVSHPRSDEGPAWAPDGRKLVFSSSRRGNHDLYQVDVTGRNLRRITRSPGHDKSPAWGPHPR